jgi:hypothetical protein
MIQIKSIKLGLPPKEATSILIRPLINSTQDLSCNTYYELISDAGELLAVGNYAINEMEYKAWADDNAHIENIVLKYLGLTRK